ncbi:unnamed protein product [Blepharisma stoltei]|uniref:Uncharacterized protein n=1 Tax=Blepharisma stoltei TaxID=1481888 RepID=A0AAU9IQL8_9CILI|nr:unnamed protein product [Blepharisma stoltei]
MVFNCNFDLPMLIKNNGNTLDITPYKRGLKGLKKSTVSMMKPHDIEPNKVSCPKVIIKFPGKIKRLVNKLKELPESWPETNQDAVIQRFIRPKGLRATKYRVVLKENFNPKVYIFTNRDRFDSQNDPIPHHIAANSQFNDTEILHEIKRTVIDHKQILKLLHSSVYNPYLRSQSAAKFLDLSQASPEKMKVFELFNNDYGAAHKKKIQKFKSITMTARYTTKTEQNKCDIYEGKTQSYVKIIEMALYIQDKINKFVLKDRALCEFVLDFLQDYKGNWYFLRIEYGKTKEISRMKLKPRLGRIDFKRHSDDKGEIKQELSYIDDKRWLFPRKKSLGGKLNLSLINWK